MAKVKKVYKYGTGEVIPKEAVYLSTQVETEEAEFKDGSGITRMKKNKFVWHYFLVDADDGQMEDRGS